MTGNWRPPAVDTTWLARLSEEIINPALPIIDCHHHLWDLAGYRYFLDDLLADLDTGHNVVATVFVQCGYAYFAGGPEELRPIGETRCIAAIGDEAARRGSPRRIAAAIVGFADLRLAEKVDAVLEAHVAAAGGRFRGIRMISALDAAVERHLLPPPPANLLADRDFRAGFSRLSRFDLSFDAWLYHPQIPELADLAGAFPETPIVLNHMGGVLGIGPYKSTGDGVFRSWRSSILELARHPNVHAKLGGVGLWVSGRDYHLAPLPASSGQLADDWRPYIDTCIEAFGVDRCMFESNFPVDKATCSYAVLWNAFKRLAAGASAGEKAALFHDNARRFYRLF
jgi:predicted TIM-barrel fold metal-dependent hydrolase